MDVFFDETGYTGPDLVNPAQPVYAVASLNLNREVCSELVSRHFAGSRAAELKHSTLAATRRGPRQIAACLQDLLRNHSNAAATAVAHKAYVLLAYVIDFWIEPAMHLDGVDLYERGGNIGLTNVTWAMLQSHLSRSQFAAVLAAAQSMLRQRSSDSYVGFFRELDRAVTARPELGEILSYIDLSDRRLGGMRHLVSLPDGLPDIGTYGLLELASHWRRTIAEPFRIVHDRSKALAREQHIWEVVLSPDVPAAIVGHDRRTIQFPLGVTEVQHADSRDYPELQLTDILAGATSV